MRHTKKILFLFAAIILGVNTFGLSPASAEEEIRIIEPRPSVHIPGLQFSDPKQIAGETETFGEGQNTRRSLQIPFLGEYIAAIYRYAIGVAVILAIFMIIVSGFQWAFSGGSQDAIGGAKKRIVGAVSGLILAVSSYAILYTINPELVRFRSLTITYIEGQEAGDYVSGYDLEGYTGQTSEEVGTVPGDNVFGKKSEVPEQFVADLKWVAEEMKKQGWGIRITSGYRSVADQVRLIRRNCTNPPGDSRSCQQKTPKNKHPQTCIFRNSPAGELDSKKCPHTTGLAIDVWGTDERGRQCIKQAQCNRNPASDACRRNACQKELIRLMKIKNFCVLDSESWHFEKPKLSSKCR